MNPILQLRDSLPGKLKNLVVRGENEPILWMGTDDFRYSDGTGWTMAEHKKNSYWSVSESQVCRIVASAFVGWNLPAQGWFSSHHADIHNNFSFQGMVTEDARDCLAEILKFTREHEGFFDTSTSSTAIFTLTGLDPSQQIVLDQCDFQLKHTVNKAGKAPFPSIYSLLDEIRDRNQHILCPAMDEPLVFPREHSLIGEKLLVAKCGGRGT